VLDGGIGDQRVGATVRDEHRAVDPVAGRAGGAERARTPPERADGEPPAGFGRGDDRPGAAPRS